MMKHTNKQSKKIILIALILLIAGCGTSTQPRKDINFRVGNTGLALEFLKGTPPQNIFEGSVLPVTIKVKNNGAYSITGNEKAILSLGVEKDYTTRVNLLTGGRVAQLGTNAASFSLEGKSAINPLGDEESIVYNINTGRLDPQSETHASTVIATLCYPYQTILESNVCVDTDINNLRPAKKVCNMQDLTFNNGQGAPVAVTKVEINMLPTISGQTEPPQSIIPQFLIYIENRGQGTVIKKEAVNEFCTRSDTTHANFNIVYVNAYLGGSELKCQLEAREKEPPGHIKLKDDKDIIWCSLEQGFPASQDPFLSPLKIELNYGYTQSIAANYIIQKTKR